MEISRCAVWHRPCSPRDPARDPCTGPCGPATCEHGISRTVRINCSADRPLLRHAAARLACPTTRLLGLLRGVAPRAAEQRGGGDGRREGAGPLARPSTRRPTTTRVVRRRCAARRPRAAAPPTGAARLARGAGLPRRCRARGRATNEGSSDTTRVRHTHLCASGPTHTRVRLRAVARTCAPPGRHTHLCASGTTTGPSAAPPSGGAGGGASARPCGSSSAARCSAVGSSSYAPRNRDGAACEEWGALITRT